MAQPPATIERLGLDEAERLRSLRLRALRDAPQAFASTWEETAARPPESWPQQLASLPTFVAVQGGADVGMVRGAQDTQRPGRAWLLSMWVDPQSRTHGIGAALVAALVGWARQEGFEELALEVGDDNAAAIGLYARMGFEPTGVRSTLPPPRDAVQEHERVLHLAASGEDSLKD